MSDFFDSDQKHGDKTNGYGDGLNNRPSVPPQSGYGSSKQSAVPPQSGYGSSNQSAVPPQSGYGSSNQSSVPPQSGYGSNNQSAVPPQSGYGSSGQSSVPPQSGADPYGRNPYQADPRQAQYAYRSKESGATTPRYEPSPAYADYTGQYRTQSVGGGGAPSGGEKKQISRVTLAVILAVVMLVSNVLTLIIVYNVTKSNIRPMQVVVNDSRFDINYTFDDETYLAAANKAIVSVVDLRFYGPNMTGATTQTRGSGVIIGMDGDYPLVVTNRHVIENAINTSGVIDRQWTAGVKFAFTDYYIENGKGATGIVDVLGYDAAVIVNNKVESYQDVVDIALLRLNIAVTNLENIIMPIADSTELYYGQSVLAIGNALGEGLSVTTGVVSKPEFTTTIYLNDENSYTNRLVQHSAIINSGNSGGALINLKGELVGINTYTPGSKVDSGGMVDVVSGISYAIPSNMARAVCDNIARNYSTSAYSTKYNLVRAVTPRNTKTSYGIDLKETVYPELGLTIVSVPKETAIEYIRPRLEVSSVSFGSAAYRAGVRTGDTLVTIGGKTISDSSGSYVYHANVGFPSSLLAEDILLYFGKSEKTGADGASLGNLVMGFAKSDGTYLLATYDDLWLQETIPFGTETPYAVSAAA